MLQAPSHLSRVCGHGHIKKFWLMQTQKENQVCESKSSILFSSPTSRPSNRTSVKGLDNSPWSSSSSLPHSSGYGDAAVTPSKHSSFACAESLTPPSPSCKTSPPLSPHSTGSTEALANKERTSHFDGVDSLSRSLCRDAHPATPSPRPHPLNVVSDQHCQGSAVVSADVDHMVPSPICVNYSSEEPLSSSTQHSLDSHSSCMHSPDVQKGYITHPLVETSSNQSVKFEDRSSPANLSRDSSHLRIASTSGVDYAHEKGRGGGILGNRMQDVINRDHGRLAQAAYLQHPALKACSLCGTTKTPMWRSGPQGPKSLCNACGIRFKKYRSFPGQSESPELISSSHLGSAASKPLSRPLKRKQNTLLSPCDPPRPQKMCFKPAVPDVVPRQQQKNSKWHHLVVKREHGGLQDLKDSSSPWCAHAGPPSLKKIYGCSPFQSKFKKLAPMDEHLSVSRVFAKDEEEAAVLLMHLSCGLVY